MPSCPRCKNHDLIIHDKKEGLIKCIKCNLIFKLIDIKSTCINRNKNNSCKLSINQGTCMMDKNEEMECSCYKINCMICNKEIEDVINPIENILICEPCYKKRIKYYGNKYNKSSLNKKDMQKIFQFILDKGKKIIKKTSLESWLNKKS